MLGKLAESPEAYGIVTSAVSMTAISVSMHFQRMDPNWEPVIAGITIGVIVWYLGAKKREELVVKEDLARLRHKTNQIEKENEELKRRLDKN